MKRWLLLLPLLVLFLLPSAPAGAHERWFVDASRFATDWSFATDPMSLLLIGAAVAIAVVWRFVFLRLPSPELKPLMFLGRLAPWIPRLLGIHLGVSLLALAIRGAFLAPSLSVHTMPGGDLLAFAEALVGIWFITGFHLRPASIFFVLIGPAALLISGPVALLEALPLLGIAGFLILMPPTPNGWGATELNRDRIRAAMQVLRAGVGLALIVIAFSEKFANPALAQAVLNETPQLNVFNAVGLGLDTETFIRIAAAIELLFGLLILSGAGAQVVVLVAAVPFNATLVLFGLTELIGHLPMYGAFLALLVYGSHELTSRDIASLKPARVDEVEEYATT